MSVDDEVFEAHAIVKGVVQGVGFRATARKIALRQHLVGTARNQPDGSVEIYVQGSKREISLFFEMITQETFGSIESLSIVYESLKTPFTGFHVVS